MKERYDELIKLIEKANVEYYTLDNPSVTDREYDNWMSELLDIEEKYPELKRKDSPSEKIGPKEENKVIDKKQMYTNDNNDNKEGRIISHEQYGNGVVVKCDGSLISVAFKTGIKKLMKNHKSIKKIN